MANEFKIKHGFISTGDGSVEGEIRITGAGYADNGQRIATRNWATQYLSDNSYATTTDISNAIDALVASAPGTLDTLNELAAALGDDPNFSTTVTNSIATKLPLAGGTMSGNIRWTSTGKGLEWVMNTDGAGIKFYNTGDSDTNSRLEYYTTDNGNEYHRFMVATNEEMTIKSDGVRVTNNIYMGGNIVATQSWVSTRGYGQASDITAVNTRIDEEVLPLFSNYAGTGHTHVIGDVTGLQAALDGKQPTGNYLTSYTETDTLDSVADRGATTNQILTVGGLKSTGDVGIGTTSPLARLHVSGGDGDVALLLEADVNNANEAWNPLLHFKQDAGNINAYIGLNGEQDALWPGAPGNGMYINPDEELQIASSNVPIANFTSGQLEVLGIILANGGNSDEWNTAYSWGNHASAGYITSADGGNAQTLDGINSTSFLRSDATDTFTGQLIGNRSDENLKVSGIRGQAKGSQTGEYIHLYERVHIGGPSGWGAASHGAPSYGLSVWGSVNFGMNGSGVIQLDDTTIVTAARELTNVTNSNWDTAYGWGNHATQGYITDGNTNWNNTYGFITASDSITGNAATATRLATARNIALSGAVTGSANFDGSGNITISTTATSDPTLTLAGDASGSATFTNLGNATLTVTVANDSHTHDGRYYTEAESDARFVNVTGDTITGDLAISGATLSVTSTAEGSEAFFVDGVNGRLFTISDDLSDSLFSANTISGLPVIEAFADNTVKLGPYSNPVIIDSSGNLSIGGTTAATQTYVDTAISNLIGGAPGALDTLNELAAAINDDASYASTVTTALGTKAPLASPALTGTPTAPTAAASTNSTQIATTAFVKAQGYVTTDTNYYLNGISRSGNVLTFSVNGATNQTYTFGSAAWSATSAFDAAGSADAVNTRIDNEVLPAIPTNNNQLTNGAGYITGYTETDTLATVTGRGNTTSGSINVHGNILLTGPVTTTNQGRMIDFTGFDKEGTTDFSDRAYIQHTTNTGGHSGSVLVISSMNDSGDGIAFLTNGSSKLKHNSNNIATEAWVQDQGYITSSGANYYVDGLSFDTGNGILTASVNGTTNQTVDLDGRYLLSGSNAVSSSKLVGSYSIGSQPGTNNLLYTGQISAGTTGLFPTSDNSNSIITLNRHSGNYDSQLGFSSNGNIYYRKFSNSTAFTTQAWLQVWHSGNFTQTAINNWTTAYNWGNHASAGYLTSIPAEYLTEAEGNALYQPIGSYQAAGTYNTIIGTDSDINTSGATIIDNIYVTDGVITSMGTRTLTAADLGIAKPGPAEALSLTIVNDTINVTFNQSPSSVDNYLIFSSVDGGDYGLISVLSPQDMGATMSIIDSTFRSSGVIAYRIYAVSNGIYSDPLEGNVNYTTPTEEVANLSSVSLNTAYYIQWDGPVNAIRFVDRYVVYADIKDTQASLTRNDASLVYDGQNTNYMYAVSSSNFDKYHQFWVEVIYR
jgi:hypothetical protein